MIKFLEWLAFGGSLVSVYLYGRSRIYGPYAGLAVSILFMIYGIAAGIYAAAFSNIIFFALHMKNLLKERKESMTLMKRAVTEGFNAVVAAAHGIAHETGWWDEYDSLPENVRKWWVATKLCLIHSEISEGMEGHRKGLADDHLPHRTMLEVELADAVIRIADLAGGLGLDVAGAIAEKMEYNAIRPDHKREVRAQSEGKTY